MNAIDYIVRPATPQDKAVFERWLEAGWPGSNGYHETVLRRWADQWPGVLDEFEAFLAVETPRGLAGFGGIQGHAIAYTEGQKRALADHFLNPEMDPREAIVALERGLADWARERGYVRLTLNMEPQEVDLCEALASVGCFPERAAMFCDIFPHPPEHPAIRTMRPEEYPQVVEMGAKIAQHLQSFPGNLGQFDLPTLVRLTDEAYKDYGATRPHTFLVAEQDQKIVGFLFAVVDSPEVGLLYDSYVEPEYRRRGLYRALNHLGSEWLFQQGVTWLTASVFVQNVPPYRFVTDWGFFPYFVAWELNLR